MPNVDLSQGIDLDGLSPEGAFAILGNKIRLDTLRVLWQATVTNHDVDTTTPLSYSELLGRVNLSDSGQFNYHLSKLTPHFVRDVEDGYCLIVIIAVIFGTVTETRLLQL